MRTPFLFSAVLLCLGSPANVLLAGDWFVSPSGDDGAGQGTEEDPWRTISHALSQASAEDTVHLAAGTYGAVTGEAFPIRIIDGITITGPQDTTDARIECDRTEVMFNGSADDWKVKFLELDNTLGSGAGVSMFADLGGSVDRAVIRSSMVIAANQMVDFDSAGDVTIVNNVILDALNAHDQPGIYLETGHDTDGFAEWRIRGNQVHGFRDCVKLRGDSDMLLADLDVLFDNNHLEDPASMGLLYDGDRGPSVDWTVEGNTITGAGIDGFRVDDYMISGYMVGWGTIRFNSITGSSGAGLQAIFQVSGGTSFSSAGGNIHVQHAIYGNLASNNTEAGMVFRANPCASSCTGAIYDAVDMGGGFQSVESGRNVLFGNGNHALEVLGGDAFDWLRAEGNWWGTLNPSTIEDLVQHRPDGENFWRVDYDSPLLNSLNFDASPGTVAFEGGTVVTVTAEAQNAFVPLAGAEPLLVTVAGVPASNVVVNASGTQLTFTSPPLSIRGKVLLRIKNPGGVSGSTVLRVIPDQRSLADGPLDNH